MYESEVKFKPNFENSCDEKQILAYLIPAADPGEGVTGDNYPKPALVSFAEDTTPQSRGYGNIHKSTTQQPQQQQQQKLQLRKRSRPPPKKPKQKQPPSQQEPAAEPKPLPKKPRLKPKPRPKPKPKLRVVAPLSESQACTLPLPPSNPTNKFFDPIAMKPITDNDDVEFKPLQPPNPPRRPPKAYDMRNLRKQLLSLEDDTISRNKDQQTLFKQNLLLWERIEKYKSNIEENHLVSLNTINTLNETLKVDSLNKKRHESFKTLKNAATLKKEVGPELEATLYKTTSALHLAKTLQSKLEEEMQEIAREKAGVMQEVEKVNEVGMTLTERKRVIERSVNLGRVEEQVFGIWIKSSRGLIRAFALLRLAVFRSAKLAKVTHRFHSFTSQKWVRVTLSTWKLYHKRNRFHPQQIPIRHKKKLGNVFRSWKSYTAFSVTIKGRFNKHLLRRLVKRWKLCITSFLEKKHHNLYLRATANKLLLRKTFSAMKKHHKNCILPESDYVAYSAFADKLFRKFLFRRWSRVVLGVRLANNWNSDKFRQLCSRSRMRILKARFVSMQRHTVMERIARQRLSRNVFDKWVLLVGEGRGKFDCQYTADNHNHVRRLKWGILKFKKFVLANRKLKVAVRFRLCKLFSFWLESSNESKSERIFLLVAVNHYFRKLARVAFGRLNYKELRLQKFLLHKRKELARGVVRTWRKVVSLTKHNQKLQNIVENITVERGVAVLFEVFCVWVNVSRRRRRCTRNYAVVRKRVESRVARRKLSAWRILFMRTKRGNNALVKLNTNSVKKKLEFETEVLACVETENDELIENCGVLDARVKALGDQEVEYDFKKEGVEVELEETQVLFAGLKGELGEKGGVLTKVKRDIDKFELIDAQRVRELERSGRELKLKRMKAKKVLEVLKREGEELQNSIKLMYEVMKGENGGGMGEEEEEEEEESQEVKNLRRERVLTSKLEQNNELHRQEKEKGEIAADRIAVLHKLVEKNTIEKNKQEQTNSGEFMRKKLVGISGLKGRVGEVEERGEEGGRLLVEKDMQIAQLKDELMAVRRNEKEKEIEKNTNCIAISKSAPWKSYTARKNEKTSLSKNQHQQQKKLKTFAVTPSPLGQEALKVAKANAVASLKDEYYSEVRKIELEKTIHSDLGNESESAKEDSRHDLEGEIDKLKSQIMRRVEGF